MKFLCDHEFEYLRRRATSSRAPYVPWCILEVDSSIQSDKFLVRYEGNPSVLCEADKKVDTMGSRNHTTDFVYKQ